MPGEFDSASMLTEYVSLKEEPGAGSSNFESPPKNRQCVYFRSDRYRCPERARVHERCQIFAQDKAALQPLQVAA